MGNKDKLSFKERKLVTAIGAACCVASLVLNAAALGTDNWLTSGGCAKGTDNATCSEDSSLSVNYGLFKGTKRINAGLSDTSYVIRYVCGSANATGCMWSCGDTEQKRQDDLLHAADPSFVPSCTPITQRTSQRYFYEASTTVAADLKLMDYGLWVATIFFISLTLLLQLVASVLCGLNVVTNPIEVWTGPFGIYVTNALSVFSAFLTLAIWGGQFGTNLSVNIAIRETLIGTWKQENSALGFSYWFVFTAALLNIITCICIRFRNILRQPGIANPEDEEPTTNGAVLLF